MHKGAFGGGASPWPGAMGGHPEMSWVRALGALPTWGVVAHWASGTPSGLVHPALSWPVGHWGSFGAPHRVSRPLEQAGGLGRGRACPVLRCLARSAGHDGGCACLARTVCHCDTCVGSLGPWPVPPWACFSCSAAVAEPVPWCVCWLDAGGGAAHGVDHLWSKWAGCCIGICVARTRHKENTRKHTSRHRKKHWRLGGKNGSEPNREIVSFRSCVRAGEARRSCLGEREAMRFGNSGRVGTW